MSGCKFYDHPDDAKVACDDCDWTGTHAETGIIQSVEERLTPGCTVPSGECPDCGSLAYLDEKPDAPTVASIEAEVARLKAAGWTRDDFAAALAKLLEE